MPTFKHPCPHCGTFIGRDVVACPACGRADPFVPSRCGTCRAPIEDPSWKACPKCGQPVGAAAASAAGAAEAAVAAETAATPNRVGPVVATPSIPSSGVCSACASPLAPGAGFCRDCGTPAG